MTVELRSKEMPPTDQVTTALSEHFHSIHPRIGVKCIPSHSLDRDDDDPVVYEITFDPSQGVEMTADVILSSVQVALHNAFRYGVSVSSNLTHKR